MTMHVCEECHEPFYRPSWAYGPKPVTCGPRCRQRRARRLRERKASATTDLLTEANGLLQECHGLLCNENLPYTAPLIDRIERTLKEIETLKGGK